MKKFMQIVSCITILIFLRTGFAIAADQVYFYYTEPSGTPMAMSDASGNVVWKSDYMPFGEELLDTATVENNKMFVGKEKDKETGFYYFGARYMDSTAGRFVSTDPAGPVEPRTGKIIDRFLLNPQRLNKYAYAGNNPYSFVDLLGLDWFLSQMTGRVVHVDNSTGAVTDYGIVAYSGTGVGLDNPAMQNVKDVGPIVQGTYTIGDMSNDVFRNGMKLKPDASTAALIKKYGRGPDSFWWHGDYIGYEFPTYEASTGCVISQYEFRKKVAKSGDRTLRVVDYRVEDMDWGWGIMLPPAPAEVLPYVTPQQ